MPNLKVVLKGEKGDVEIEAEAKNFKSGTQGYYFRDRVELDGEDCHVQLIISRK